MQFKLFTFAALALTALAVATPARRNDGPSKHCNTSCCQTVATADSNAASTVISLLGIMAQDPTAIVGLACSPIDVISSNSWYVFALILQLYFKISDKMSTTRRNPSAAITILSLSFTLHRLGGLARHNNSFYRRCYNPRLLLR
ncbi:LOW QUALITY PROTEIN: hypothetical protein CVT25_011697 [Psilocybe cyanescens]|uniref:Hydrophobin n=1 Tax=Psilocybe cyanescens TaxID=93625 RepID=A0A409WIH5_PSICY|nr:LOW QUALITY PROTEIN: hypothetical protein CVT25_011697 [Psilocybe cyanescens]